MSSASVLSVVQGAVNVCQWFWFWLWSSLHYINFLHVTRDVISIILAPCVFFISFLASRPPIHQVQADYFTIGDFEPHPSARTHLHAHADSQRRLAKDVLLQTALLEFICHVLLLTVSRSLKWSRDTVPGSFHEPEPCNHDISWLFSFRAPTRSGGTYISQCKPLIF